MAKNTGTAGTELDARTQRGKELADRLNMQTVFDKMPKLYYVADLQMGRYRVGRTDWPGDVFEFVTETQFEAFKNVYERLSMPLINLDDYPEELWDKITSSNMNVQEQLRRYIDV